MSKTACNEIKFIDLCSGIGGFHLALKEHNTDCLLSCDIDKYANKTYQANFSNKSNNIIYHNDIKTLDPLTIPDFDLLCAGFPCQAFSLAGKQQGFNDMRGTIFFDIANILKTKQPKAFFMENVKNLKSHDKGNTLKVINNTLTQLGYYHTFFEFDSSVFVPQKRQRIYFIGIHKDYIKISDFQRLIKNINLQYKLAFTQAKSSNNINFWNILEPEKINNDLSSNLSKYVLSDKLWAFLQAHANKHSEAGNGFGYGLMTNKDTISRTLTARYYKDGSEILIKRQYHNTILNPRKLTPRECARLMGFPEDFKIIVSNTQAYKQFGNSVVVPVLKMISNQLIQEIVKI